jgi:hypothetical protein
VYAHGLLHSVRNDGECYGYRLCEVLRGTKQSNPVYAHGLLHCVRNDGSAGGLYEASFLFFALPETAYFSRNDRKRPPQNGAANTETLTF